MQNTILRLWMAVLIITIHSDVIAQQLTPEQTGGVYYAYPVKDSKRINIPDGFQIFYISHYGRHGSRWVDSKRRYKWVMSHFTDKRNLTPPGLETREKLLAVCKNARGKAGLLTPLGKSQHEGIARRMATNYPELFKPGAVVTAQSSTYKRCRQSMQAFCGELRRQHPSLSISMSSKKSYKPYINLPNEDMNRLKRQTKRNYEVNPDRFMRNLFIDPSRCDNPIKLLTETHTIASDMQDIPLDISLWNLFTYEEMMAVYKGNNDWMTFINGDHKKNEGIPVKTAIPLWNHIVEVAYEYIANNKHGASLIFGHDQPLYRLITLIGLSLPGTGMDDILPMAANLQLIFMKDQNNEIYVSFIYNETQQNLPIENTPIPGIYKWKDVEAFVTTKIVHYLLQGKISCI